MVSKNSFSYKEISIIFLLIFKVDWIDIFGFDDYLTQRIFELLNI